MPAGADDRRPRTASRRIWLAIGLADIGGSFLLRALTAGIEDAGLTNQFQGFLTLSISVIIESLPCVVLGIVLSIVVQVWVPNHVFLKLLPRNRLGRRIVISVLGCCCPSVSVETCHWHGN